VLLLTSTRGVVVDVVVWWTVVSVKVWLSSWFVTVVVDAFSLTCNGVVIVDVLLLLLVGGGGGYCLTRGGVVVVGKLSWSPSWLLLLVGGWWLMFDAWHLGGGGGVVVVVKVVVLVVVRCVEVVEGQGCGRSTVRTDLVTDPSPAKTGTGTLRVIFFSPVPVPWYPVPVTRHRVTYP